MPERTCKGCVKQAEWGCEAVKYLSTENNPTASPSPDGTWWAWHNPAAQGLKFDGEDIYCCPRQPLRSDVKFWNQLFLYFGAYKQGYLPQSGAVMDQSNKAMELFRIVDAANFEADESLMASRQKGNPNADAPRPKGPPR